MKMNKSLLVLTAACAFAACNSNENNEHKADEPVAFHQHYIDSSHSPCDNFYKFAIGNWQKENPVPETESRWMAFNILADENRKKLLTILDEIQEDDQVKEGSEKQLIRDFYLAGMDSVSVKSNELKHILPILESIQNINDVKGISTIIGELIPKGIGTPVSFYVGRDDKNSSRYITSAYQTGLSLPDRDFYLKEDEKNQTIRSQYQAHIDKMFSMAGLSTANAGATVLALETKIAEAQRPRQELRDPDKNYNLKARADWDAEISNINIQEITEALGLEKADTLIVGQPDFYLAINDMFTAENLESLKTYLSWKTLTSYASYMGAEMEQENFDFFATKLKGTAQMKPRNERVLGTIDGSLGQPLGKLFVAKHFPKESKQYMEEMIENLRKAYRESINNLEWMTDATKEKALKKLNSFTYKIGYPEEWKDYSSLKIDPKEYLLNAMNTSIFNYKMMIDKLGKPIDKKEWFMTPQMVNAYYSSSANEIVFPAGILQPPFFHPSFDKAINYGGIGAVIGHEFTHGFDDQGSKYDWDGNLNNWWTQEDRTAFEKLAGQLANQYSSYAPVEGMNINGKMTLGENIADLGGLTLAYNALKKDLGENQPEPIDGFTWQQRFFLGWANVWKGNITQKELKNRLVTDYHSPAEYRVLGPLSNIDEFYEAFGTCDKGNMLKDDSTRIRIW